MPRQPWGFPEISAFYPDFKISPKDIDSLTYEAFKKAVDAKLNNFMFPSTDFYIMTKYREGFFDEDNGDEVLESYTKCFKEVISPLEPLFPDYKN